MAASGAVENKHAVFPTILRIVGAFVVVAGLALCLLISVPRLLGVSGYVILTGSMEPTIPVGSLVYVKAAEPAQLAEGDVILFYTPETGEDTPVAHRVVENQVEDGLLITKGDANVGVDIGPVRYENVIGKVVRSVPTLGRLGMPLSTMMGKIGLFLTIVAGLILMEVGRKLREAE